MKNLLTKKVSVGAGMAFSVDQYGSREDAWRAMDVDAKQRLLFQDPAATEIYTDAVCVDQDDESWAASATGIIQFERVEVPVDKFFNTETDAREDAVKRLKDTYPGVEPIGYGVQNYGYESDVNYLGAYAYGYIPVKERNEF